MKGLFTVLFVAVLLCACCPRPSEAGVVRHVLRPAVAHAAVGTYKAADKATHVVRATARVTKRVVY